MGGKADIRMIAYDYSKPTWTTDVRETRLGRKLRRKSEVGLTERTGPVEMYRKPANRRTETLLDQRDDLKVRISLFNSSANCDPQKMSAMVNELSVLERRILNSYRRTQ